MELVTKKRLTIVAGRVNQELALEVAERLSLGLAPLPIAEFANGEIHCKYGESIRGADLFICPECKSTLMMRLAPATSNMFASSLAVIGSRPSAFRSWRPYP